MIYVIVGTDKEIRDKAQKEILSLGKATVHLYSEQIAGLLPFIEATSLFGEKTIVNLIQTMDVASSRAEVVKLLPKMKESPNIFIIDEPFADATRIKMLSKYSEKLFNAKEEVKKNVDVFTLCSRFAVKDKKGTWLMWMKVRDIEAPEGIHGALWWKASTLWSDVRNKRPCKFTLSECEVICGRLLRASLDAHRGKKDLKTELESIILSI